MTTLAALLTTIIVTAPWTARLVPRRLRARRWVAWLLVGLTRAASRFVWRPLNRVVHGGASGYATLAVVVGLFVGALTAPGAYIALVAAAVVGCAGRVAPKPPADDGAWWGERRLVGALVDARLVTEGAAIRRLGQPQHSDRGVSIKVQMPPSVTAVAVAKRRDVIAASLGVPVAHLEVGQSPAEPPNVMWLRVWQPVDLRERPAAVAATSRSSWREPVTIGRDQTGKPVVVSLHEQNTLISGVPGSGKTSVARILLGAALLDPDATIYLADGKASRADYGAAATLCRRVVWGDAEDAPEALAAMLAEVLDVVRRRNAGTEHGGGVLVLLEELQDLRAAASKADQDAIDTTLSRIVRMGRAAGVHILVSTQRPSVDDVPSAVRNLLTQRLALQSRNPADAGLTLGTAPTLPLPSKRGEAILATPTGQRSVVLDRLTDDAWRSLCGRAPRREQPAPAEAPQAPTTLLDDVASIVDNAGGEATPAEVLAALPARHGIGSTVSLGRQLSGCGVRSQQRGGRRVYTSASVHEPSAA